MPMLKLDTERLQILPLDRHNLELAIKDFNEWVKLFYIAKIIIDIYGNTKVYNNLNYIFQYSEMKGK